MCGRSWFRVRSWLRSRLLLRLVAWAFFCLPSFLGLDRVRCGLFFCGMLIRSELRIEIYCRCLILVTSGHGLYIMHVADAILTPSYRRACADPAYLRANNSLYMRDDLYAILSFFTWILRISFVVFSVSSVILTWFIHDTSVKISRKDPNSSLFSHVYPRKDRNFICGTCANCTL